LAHLEDEEPVLGVDDDEVRLAIPRGTAVAHRAEPLCVRVQVEGVGRKGGPDALGDEAFGGLPVRFHAGLLADQWLLRDGTDAPITGDINKCIATVRRGGGHHEVTGRLNRRPRSPGRPIGHGSAFSRGQDPANT
jgi:hypothetical protein